MNNKIIDALAVESADLLQTYLDEHYGDLVLGAIREAMENNSIEYGSGDSWDVMMEIAGRIKVTV